MKRVGAGSNPVGAYGIVVQLAEQLKLQFKNMFATLLDSQVDRTAKVIGTY